MITIKELEQKREERGLEIAHKESQVKQVEENFYAVLSQSGNGEYAVFKVDKEWTCECPDNRFRQLKCKHIFAVETSIKIKEQVKTPNPLREFLSQKLKVNCHFVLI